MSLCFVYAIGGKFLNYALQSYYKKVKCGKK